MFGTELANYRRLEFVDREEISREIAAGSSLREVAKALQRSPNTIIREVNRCAVGRKFYRAFYAHGRSSKILHKPHNNQKLDNDIPLRKAGLFYLAKKWSPEQIAKRLVILYPDDMNMRVSHETIYSYLYVLPRGELKREITSCLRRHHEHRYRKNKDRKTPELCKTI